MYSIGQVAEMFGLPISTLRYYDKQGLFPNMERVSGIRKFSETEIEALRVIECLKKAGMSLKDIREYIHLAMEGDSTIEERLQLFYRQRKILQAQMEELQHTMDVLDFKCWYYETARDAGTVQVPQSMSVEELPPQFRNLKRDLAKVPIVD